MSSRACSPMHARSCACVNDQLSDEFGVGVGMHQGSLLRPLLFITVLEVLLQEFHLSVLRELANKECNSKQKQWKEGMEGKSLRVNIKKIIFMICGLNGFNFCVLGCKLLGPVELPQGQDYVEQKIGVILMCVINLYAIHVALKS